MCKNVIVLKLSMLLILITNQVFGQGIEDYLIVNDFYGYIASKNPSIGKGPGILAPADHFFQDHKDTTYSIFYFNIEKRTGAEVQVTQHIGGESDFWLLHELSRDFRNYYGLPGDSYVMRQINGSKIMAVGSGGWTYRWLSGNKVIQIGYTDLQMTKPEPLEIVSAYLNKHPSTLVAMTSAELRTKESESSWIKAEMERRLWLCDKWFQQLDAGKSDLSKALYAITKDNLEVFLNYRNKYYDISATEEKQALDIYLNAKNDQAIRDKLSDYKEWWTANKSQSVNLP